MKDAIEYWDNFHNENPSVEPSQFLKQMLPRLCKRQSSRQQWAVAPMQSILRKNGCQVKGFDISPVAVANTLKHAEEKGVSVEAGKADLDLY